MKRTFISILAAVAFVSATTHAANAQWRTTAWTMDFKNDTDRCIALTVGEEGAPPIDQAVVWAHRGQHFDDNHLNVVVHAKVYEKPDCSGRFIADVHQPMHQLRNLMTVTQTGSTFALQRRETPDADVTSAGVRADAGPDANSAGENFQVGPSYRMQTAALANVHLGDDARTVAATARAMPHHSVGKESVVFSTAGGSTVTAHLRRMRVWSVTYEASTPTPKSAVAFARTALTQYGQKPTTQVSGAFIKLQYCVIDRHGSLTPARVSCRRDAPRLDVFAGVPVSRIDLQ